MVAITQLLSIYLFSSVLFKLEKILLKNILRHRALDKF